MSTHSQEPRPSALRRFMDWLAPTPLPETAAVPPAFGGIPPSRPISPVETLSPPRRTVDAPAQGIIASARRLIGADIDSRNKGAQGGAGGAQEWQEEAWDLLDMIGEQRFLVHTLAGRMGQAGLYVGEIDPAATPGSRPEQTTDPRLQALIHSLGGGISGQSQLLHRSGVNLSVAGEFWLVGIPPRLIPGTPEHLEAQERAKGARKVVDRGAEELASDDVLALEWRAFSVTEISVDSSKKVKLTLEDGTPVEGDIAEFFAIRVWRPHPRRAWEADSPTRASLPVLRELLGLTQHVGAQIDSRLAGAGILAVSAEVDAALKRAAGLEPSDPRSPLLEALTLAMQTPIKDRANASAIVPLTVNVPGKPSEAFHHLTFSTPFDKETAKMREEAIRRLALGQDAPPELLLGTAGMNHWGAWLVREDVVKTHLEPPLALICDALTREFLRPVMLSMGYTDEEAERHAIWYDVDHLIARPNRTQDAKDLYAAGAISDAALLEALGFESTDAPETATDTTTDPAVEAALRMVEKAPSLVQNPGIPVLVEQLRQVLDGSAAPVLEELPVEDPSTPSGLPASTPETAPAGTPAAESGAPTNA